MSDHCLGSWAMQSLGGPCSSLLYSNNGFCKCLLPCAAPVTETDQSLVETEMVVWGSNERWTQKKLGGTTAGKLCILAQYGPILSLTNKNLVFPTPIWPSIVVLRLLQQTQRIKFKYKWILWQDNTGIFIWMSTFFLYVSLSSIYQTSRKVQ